MTIDDFLVKLREHTGKFKLRGNRIVSIEGMLCPLFVVFGDCFLFAREAGLSWEDINAIVAAADHKFDTGHSRRLLRRQLLSAVGLDLNS